MPYVYEGEDTVRVQGQRYSKGSTTEDESVKGKSGWREVSDDEAADIASERPGTFKDAKPDAWQQKFGEMAEWVGHASVSAPLNRVIGDNEAPYGPPTGTITTKQAVMREASNSNERNAFGDHEWLPEDAEERNLADSTSGKIQAAQAEQSGKLEKVTEEILDSGDSSDESTTGSSDTASQSQKPARQQRQPSPQGQSTT
jgi:hypothetical protein